MLLISGAIAIDKEEANNVLRYLLKVDSVNKSLRIRLNGDRVLIPVKYVPEKFRDFFSEFDFEPRSIEDSPLDKIRENLSGSGIPPHCIPEKWVRYGDSVVIRSNCSNDQIGRIAQEISCVLGVTKVYNWEGAITGNYRRPNLKRILGDGGEVIHYENGISYAFDPEKVMFSPGNVNERVRIRNEKVHGRKIMDMFCGIGYFTLGLAVYGKPDIIYACDINPDSVHYLEKNASLNKVSRTINTFLGDSRVMLPDLRVDLVVMGNFKSEEFLPHALKRIKNGGSIIMHHLVSTENLCKYREVLCSKVRKYGYKAVVEDSHIVKSYGPNYWHISSKLRILYGGDFG